MPLQVIDGAWAASTADDVHQDQMLTGSELLWPSEANFFAVLQLFQVTVMILSAGAHFVSTNDL